ncbi:DUF190 domain-containing protein [Thiorhodospira sibirica]|uniref:DUF190 domain-containing protein n=1 Tax=Thiorhodospira sibirica TaxID=154347 RepID=UPI00022C58D0|nr:DUF190 domain-containing protein [Thiorhodospira sibirica]
MPIAATPTDITFVRIYVTEAHGKQAEIFRRLHDECKVRGVGLFRGIAGLGIEGILPSTALLDLALNLPVVIEFFDTDEKITQALEAVSDLIEPGHVVSFKAQLR